MGKLSRMILVACLLGACKPSVHEQAQTGTPRADRQRAKAALPEPTPDARFDAAGNLKSSYERVSWLELPAGFVVLPGATPRSASYEASGLPLAKVHAYLQQRLDSDRIDYRKNGMVFRDALPTHTRLTMPAVEVTLLEIDRQTQKVRISVEDLTPPATKPMSEHAVAQELARAQKRIE